MRADIHRPPETCQDASLGAERCAVSDDEHRADPEGGLHFRVRYKRLLWFVLIYLASLAAFAALVYGLKLIIPR
ncbi:hypothetical protein [Microvirga makkahensis]|uniref:DUF2474 domain-containing protein n=1 Tax=Microvirga makkahensis TaxID=1128670 RepID=A0A7X3MQJ7_9HYPH|nr:hypothetical protein [Microvirga makkahensis]MXQ11386.1 hypothetical protein [Microvirga makkahensis]